MKKKSWLVALLVFTVMLSGCTLFSPKNGIIYVRVQLEDGTILPGVKVTATSEKDSIEAFTNDKGIATITAHAGTYTLSTEMELFDGGKKTIKKEAEVVQGEKTDVDFKIVGLGYYSVEFVDIDTDPLPNLSVTMDFAGKETVFTTDKNGKISFSGEAGTYAYNTEYKDFGVKEGSLELSGSFCERTVQIDNTGEGLVLPEGLEFGAWTFIDEFANLDNWTEHLEFEYNQWLLIDEGKLAADGKLKRTEKVAATSSGIKLNNILVNDGAVAVKLYVSEEEEYSEGNLGIRLHLRNPEDLYCYGYGLNVSTYGYELATWHGKGASPAKTATVNPGNVPSIKRGDTTTITLVLEGDTYKYYRDGEFIAETTAEEGHTFDTGGIFLVLTEGIEIDSLAYFEL